MSAQMIQFHCKIHSSWLFLPTACYPVKLQIELVSFLNSDSASAEKEESEWCKSGSAGGSCSVSISSADPLKWDRSHLRKAQGLPVPCHFFF